MSFLQQHLKLMTLLDQLWVENGAGENAADGDDDDAPEMSLREAAAWLA